MVATGGRFVNLKIIILADQLGSSGMAARFDKLSTKKNIKNLRNYQIYIQMQSVVIYHFHFFHEI